MQNFSAIRPVVRWPLQKNSLVVAPSPLHWRGLKSCRKNSVKFHLENLTKVGAKARYAIPTPKRYRNESPLKVLFFTLHHSFLNYVELVENGVLPHFNTYIAIFATYINTLFLTLVLMFMVMRITK